MKRLAVLALVALHLSGGPAGAQDTGGSFVTVTTRDGASVALSLLRLGGDSRRGGGGDLADAATERPGEPGTVSRVIWERSSGIYFGYDVDVSRQGSSFRLEFRPLDHDVVVDLARQPEGILRIEDRPGTSPRPLATTPRFPPPQTLGNGEVLTLELLTNPSTGERIFDVLKISSEPIPGAAIEAAVARARTGQRAVLGAAALVARGRYWAAAEKYREALEVLPRDAVVHNKLGICYQQLENPVMARRSYDQALALNPDYAEVWNNIGTLEQSAERITEAVEAYKRAIRLRPDLATPWKNLGNAYLALEQPEEAFEAYQEAFRLDPTIVETQGLGIPAVGVDAAMQRFYIAKLLAANGHVDAAFEFLVKAREAGFSDFGRVRNDPDFAKVTEDARFDILF